MRYTRYRGRLEGVGGDAKFAGFLEAALDFGGGYVQQGGYLPDAFAVGLEVENLLYLFEVIAERGLFDVVSFEAVTAEGEVGVAAFFDYLI